MKIYDQHWLMGSIARDRRRIANYGVWNGRGMTAYFERCRAFHQPSGTLLCLTRDVGYHSSGWWKNPDYERCYHLSLSFFDPTTKQRAPRDKALSAEWVEAIFDADRDKVWTEPPYSRHGKENEVWHYRLFCDPAWEPIIPRGEVYDRELIEAGWQSYSDVQAALAAEQEQTRERELN